jgi:hypothetical protein
VPVWKCGCARTGQRTATRATRATRLIPTVLGSPPVRRTARARPRQGLIQVQPFGWFHPSDADVPIHAADPIAGCERG